MTLPLGEQGTGISQKITELFIAYTLTDKGAQNIELKTPKSALFFQLSILLLVMELSLLLNLFPLTGFGGRIFTIPFLFVLNLGFAYLIFSYIQQYSSLIALLTCLIFYIVVFYLNLYLWPQSSAIKKNLVIEFYSFLFYGQNILMFTDNRKVSRILPIV